MYNIFVPGKHEKEQKYCMKPRLSARENIVHFGLYLHNFYIGDTGTSFREFKQ